MRIRAPGGSGEGVGVLVGNGVGGTGVSVGVEVTVAGTFCVSASMVFIAAFAVNPMTVGKYSGGYGVGAGSVPEKTQAERTLKKDARVIIFRVSLFFMSRRRPIIQGRLMNISSNC